MKPASIDHKSPPRPRRGRPPRVSLTLDQVSDETGISVGSLKRLLEILPGALPGAEEHDVHGWIVPSTTVRALKEPRCDTGLRQEATIPEVAEAIRKSPKTIWRWCQPGPKGEILLKSRKVAGEILIDVRSVYELPAKLPSWVAPEFLVKRGSKRELAHPDCPYCHGSGVTGDIDSRPCDCVTLTKEAA